jgi:RNA polymerase sigma-70 factor, ECF subfamily
VTGAIGIARRSARPYPNTPAPWSEQAVHVVQRTELRATVRGWIDQLPEAYRTVLLLRDIEGLDTVKTACEIGSNSAVMKTRLHRARQALRTLPQPHLREA